MIDTPSDTPGPDIAARNLAERIFAAYAQQAEGPLHPQQEQALLTRLSEALRPQIAGSNEDLLPAANAALEAWEEINPDLHGPRVAMIDVAAQTVTLRLAR